MLLFGDRFRPSFYSIGLNVSSVLSTLHHMYYRSLADSSNRETQAPVEQLAMYPFQNPISANGLD